MSNNFVSHVIISRIIVGYFPIFPIYKLFGSPLRNLTKYLELLEEVLKLIDLIEFDSNI
jgi:hypothetical protein